ncbi:hypothetical protein PDESU_03831 [Pontiella desulfatans]|uniref:DUF1800 domain-containing protein n=1 Tax=Pontiella desulfatans TaxID=2750659 RepID=A0A6C2U5X0_PONDE|nr:DUF1800 domain-containing protein [Pontiella desulfatans]VGO15249.1 hypothetical protein PDESU_03831 [Pontiella desulfatans]
MKQLSPEKWNSKRAAHLLARSGFGATPEQIEAAENRPMEEVVDRILTPATDIAPPSWIGPGVDEKPNYKELQQGLNEEEKQAVRKIIQQEYNEQQRELVGWWINRMVTSPSQLQEKMTLFWHGHFATSSRKVRIPYMMYLQNQTFRKHGLGNWKELVTAVSQDPAMLIYLDNTRSKAGAANENYARELMELFTLGEGHYSEQDIKESARAFTGWMVDSKKYAFRDATAPLPPKKGKPQKNRYHDEGSKVFFGQEGHFDGHDIIRIILEQEQASKFMVAKLWRFFAYEDPEPELVDQLAAEFRLNNYEIAPVLRAMFMSKAFYGKKAIRTQIKSPAQWLAGSCIVLGIDEPDPGFGMNAMRTLCQELFAPPNVKGWDGGYAWITTSSLTQRYNLASSLLNHRPRGKEKNERLPYTVKTETVLPQAMRASTGQARDYLVDRVYQAQLPGEDMERLNAFLGAQPPANEWTDAHVRNILHVMMSTPQYQLT